MWGHAVEATAASEESAEIYRELADSNADLYPEPLDEAIDRAEKFRNNE